MHEILLFIAAGLVVVGIMLAICMLRKLPRDQTPGRAIISWAAVTQSRKANNSRPKKKHDNLPL